MTPLCLLEVGALPFPTVQGTQALLREQCEALARRGHRVHLLVYAHGAFPYEPPGYTIHRLADWPRERSLRSGPSWRKAGLDLLLAREIRQLSRELRPDLVHAHNYEALVSALFARPAAPVVYHAHTLFEHELPTFTTRPATGLAARIAGGAMDRLLPPRAAHTLAVSPLLTTELCRLGHPAEHLECSLPGIELPELNPDRGALRSHLGLEQAEVVGYCGNLDGYQGLSLLVETIGLLAPRRPALRLLVVTASDPGPLEAAFGRAGVSERLVVVPHGTFAQALERLATADVGVIPRTVPGGIPLKLLSYLGVGLPVVTTGAGIAGMDLGPAVSVIVDHDADSWARALARLLDHPAEARRQGELGQRLVRSRFTWDQRVAELEQQLFRIVVAARKHP